MRSKVPLVLMEQLVMVLVFALSAAICVQVFVHSGQASQQMRDRDDALMLAQTVAETLKSVGGDAHTAFRQSAALVGGVVAQGIWTLADAQWTMEVTETPTDVPGLVQAQVRIFSANGDLVVLPVAWPA